MQLRLLALAELNPLLEYPMSRTRITADSPCWSLRGLLLACLAMSCSVPDGKNKYNKGTGR